MFDVDMLLWCVSVPRATEVLFKPQETSGLGPSRANLISPSFAHQIVLPKRRQPMNIWLRVALPVRRERLAAGTVQREHAEHAVVVRSGARPERLRAMVGAARRRQAL